MRELTGSTTIAAQIIVSVPGALATGSGDSLESTDPVAIAPGTDTADE